MRILEIGLNYDLGGAATVMHQIAHTLRKEGHQVHVMGAYAYGHNIVHENDIVIYKKEVSDKIRQRTDWLDVHRVINLEIVLKILWYCKVNDIEVIHLHAVQGFIGIKGIAMISKLYPVVWTMHDCWGTTGGCLHPFGCNKWKNADCKQCRQHDDIETHKLQNLKKREFVNRNILFTTPSKWLKGKIQESFLRDEKILVIPNGATIPEINCVDKSKYETYGVYPDKKNILFVAADVKSKFKGYPLLRKAIEKLDGKKYRLMVIGNADRISNKMGDIEVTNFGYIKDELVKQEIMSMADVMVIPSIQENFPCVVLECMSVGTPVIGYNVGGIPEQLSGGCGWICDEITSGALKDKIEMVLDNDELIKSAGEKAKEKIKNKYNMQNVANKYVRAYRMAIRGKICEQKSKHTSTNL